MGFLDYVILIPTLLILLPTIILMVVSIRSTNEDIEKRKYKKNYMPIITMCLLVLFMLFAVNILVSIPLDY